jgi:adenine-specific DNA-methyltransferase
MASLAEREGLRGQVQCIYLDPPYGIKFNSNFQWSTTSRDVKDGNTDHITREPEQVKAFRDTWRDGIHSYLTYLRDRLTVARDLLHETGSIFVQIGDENVHRVQALLNEIFGETNCVALISYAKTTGFSGRFLSSVTDYVLWYGKNTDRLKYRPLHTLKEAGDEGASKYREAETIKALANSALDLSKLAVSDQLTSQGASANSEQRFEFQGKAWQPPLGLHWKTTVEGMETLAKAGRVMQEGKSIRYVRFLDDFAINPRTNVWLDIGGIQSRTDPKVYVVQTATEAVKRCILMATDPGDLVLDPTCGSGTTATVAEQWGRRWITIDTSRVSLALARARIMGARYSYYLLADSHDGQVKEAEVTRSEPSNAPTRGNIRHGFVYERVPHITLKSIANNAEIDVIWEKFQAKLEPLREQLNKALGRHARAGGQPDGKVDSRLRGNDNNVAWEEWEIPRDLTTVIPAKAGIQKGGKDWTPASAGVTKEAETLLKDWWEQRIARQQEIDASIAAKAEFEYLYDKPYDNKKKVRVAGPFTVESLSPHRVLGVGADDELVDSGQWSVASEGTSHKSLPTNHFAEMILENLKTAGVQQAHKEDRITFTSVTPWPGRYVCAVGTVASDQWQVVSDQKSKVQATSHKPQATEYRAAIFIGPEFGTVARQDLVAAAREAGDADFDVLIACAFNYEAHAAEFSKLGRIPVLKARMNAELHMAEDLKNTGKGNLFVIFGEPDISVVSGQWLVARSGRMVAHYDSVKELSGLGSLEEINRLGGADLPRLKRLSAGGAVRADQPDASGGRVGGGQHRRGRGSDGDRGVSPVPERGQRIDGGGGDVSDPGGPAGLSGGGRSAGAGSGGPGDQPHARRTQALAAVQALSASDFPLALSTSHYSQVTIHGVDVFHPSSGEVRSDNADGIACWFIDTDYNEESFFVRHAYFLGANDPYKSLKTTLKAEINEDAWSTLNSDTSRPFDKPKSGRIAVKVINHLGDEVMKVFRVE